MGLTLILASTSCQSEKKSSVLIIAFDRLPSETIICSDEHNTENFNLNSGFAMLCKESIRFTHSYTTSLQPAAAMGSLLSGEYPHQHQLHRSFDRISDKTELVTKLALEKKMRTSFFSGSPNILKKTGLSKYFELFDDSSAVTEKNFIKQLKSQFETFFEWYSEDPKPFFTVIYNSELQSKGSDYANTIEKIDENLAGFFIKLKDDKLWETTTILLVGLNGANKFQRLDETAFQNLHSENTQVTTLIKLPRSQGDEGIYWKNDTVIQSADLGYLLKKIIAPETSPNTAGRFGFPIIDIQKLITEKKLNPATNAQTEQRQILIEAPNSWSKNLSWIQFAVLQNQDMYIDLNQPVIYNILTDGMETTNLFKQRRQIFEKTEINLAALKKNLKLKPAPQVKRKNIFSNEHLINTNINLENIWGLLEIN